MSGPATQQSRTARRAVLLSVLVLVSVVAGLPVPASPSASDAGGATGATAGDTGAAAARTIETCTVIDTPGRYQLAADLTEATSTCIVIGASNVHLDGAGHTIDTSFEGDAVAVVGEDVSNVTVENLVIDNVQEGIRVGVSATSSVGDLTLRNNEIDSRTRAINVTISGSNTGVTVDGVTMANNALEAGDEGIAVEINEAGWTVRNLSVRGNDVRSDGVGIDVETYGDDVTVRNYEFRDNVVDSGDHGIQLIADGTGELVTGVSFVGNDVRSEIGVRSGVPIRLVANDPNQELGATIADNRLNATNVSNGNEGIFVWADGDGTEASVGVTNNTVGALTGQPPPDTGIRFNIDGEDAAVVATVRNNTVAATQQGIELDAGGFSERHTLQSTIADNDVSGPSVGIQVEADGLDNDADVAIRRNQVDVTAEGIEIDADDSGVVLTATVANNVVDGGSAAGVSLTVGGSGATVDATVDGNVVGNGNTGVDLRIGAGNDGVAVSVTDNDLTVDGAAVLTDGPVDGVVLDGNRLDGGAYGVRNYNTTSGAVNATNNDWGSSDGPNSDGPYADPVTGTLANGSGSNVTELSGGVSNVRFDPWTGKSDSSAQPIDSCTVIDEPGHYELTGNVTDATSESCIRIVVSNVTFDGNGYTIDGVSRESGSTGIVVEPISQSSVAWWPSGLGEGVENVTVRDVQLVHWAAGIKLASSTVGPIADVTVDDVGVVDTYAGITAGSGTDVTIRDSVVRNASVYGVTLGETTRATLRNNRVVNASFGVDVSYSATGTVLRDNVVRESDRTGIQVSGPDTVVRNNTVRNGESGVLLFGDDLQNATVAENAIVGNLVGIQIGPFAGASSFQDNVVRGNAIGVLLEGAQNHTFEGTTFEGNSGGSVQASPSTGEVPQSASNNTFTDVTFAGTAGTFTFTVTDAEIRPTFEYPPLPDGTADVGVFFRARNTSDAGRLDLTVTYDEAAASEVNEETLSVWRYDGEWTDLGGTVDVDANTVSTTIESFSVFAVLGEDSSGAEPISSCTVIDEPGEYVLNRSITNAEVETCIEIRASDVVFDGGGYTIDGVNRGDFSTAVEVNASSAVSNVTVRNVALTGWHSGVVVGDYSGTGVEDVIVESVTVEDSKSAIIVGAGTDVVVRNSVVRNALFMGISVSKTSNVIVRNNTLENASSGINVNEDAVDTVVRDNVLTDNEDHGISVVGRGTKVLNNTLRSNERGIRIGTIHEGSVTVSDNAVFDSNRSGISVRFVNPSVFENNTLSGNRVGVDLVGSQDHTFRNTTFDGNTEWAVRATEYFSIQSAKNVTFSGTTFADAPGEFTFTVRNVALRPGADAAPPSDTADVGVFLTVNATGEEFSSGVDLSVTYDETAASDVNEETLSVWRYDGEWTDLGGVTDADANVVSKNVSLDDTVALAVLGDPATTADVVVEGTNAPVTEGETLVVEAALRNTADSPIEERVSLIVGDVERDAKTVVLEPGEIRTVRLSWETGDGDAGTYAAQVRGEGDADEAEVSVERGSEPPGEPTPVYTVAVDETNSPVEEGERVTVVALVQNVGDAEGTEVITLSVDGTVVDEVQVPVSPGETARVTLTWTTGEGDAGERTPVVAVGGASDATSVQVESTNRPPVAEFAYSPRVPGPGEEIEFEATARDSDGTVERYEWRIDGEVVATGPEFAWRFEREGERNVTLVVTDDDGSTNETTRTVDVAVLTADLWTTPATPVTGESVSLVATTSLDDPSRAQYRWSVDGEERFVTPSPYADIVFDEPGRYQVTVEVMAPGQGTENATVEVVVEERTRGPPETTTEPPSTTTEPPPETAPPETTTPPGERTTTPGTRTTAPGERTTAPGTRTTTAPGETTGAETTRPPRETTVPTGPPTTDPADGTSTAGETSTAGGTSTADSTTAGGTTAGATDEETAPGDGTPSGTVPATDGDGSPGLGVGAALVAVLCLLVLRRR